MAKKKKRTRFKWLLKRHFCAGAGLWMNVNGKSWNNSGKRMSPTHRGRRETEKKTEKEVKRRRRFQKKQKTNEEEEKKPSVWRKLHFLLLSSSQLNTGWVRVVVGLRESVHRVISCCEKTSGVYFQSFFGIRFKRGRISVFLQKQEYDFWFASFLFFQQHHLLTSSCWSEYTSEKRIFWWFWQYQNNLDWSLFPAATGLIRKPKKPFLIRFSISDTVLFVIRKRPFFSSLHK